jgi:hypothetical protein
VTTGSHAKRLAQAHPHGYGIPLLIDKIYRDFQVKGLLRPAARRFAFLRKCYLGYPSRRGLPSLPTLAMRDPGA